MPLVSVQSAEGVSFDSSVQVYTCLLGRRFVSVLLLKSCWVGFPSASPHPQTNMTASQTFLPHLQPLLHFPPLGSPFPLKPSLCPHSSLPTPTAAPKLRNRCCRSHRPLPCCQTQTCSQPPFPRTSAALDTGGDRRTDETYFTGFPGRAETLLTFLLPLWPCHLRRFSAPPPPACPFSPSLTLVSSIHQHLLVLVYSLRLSPAHQSYLIPQLLFSANPPNLPNESWQPVGGLWMTPPRPRPPHPPNLMAPVYTHSESSPLVTTSPSHPSLYLSRYSCPLMGFLRLPYFLTVEHIFNAPACEPFF
nr:uncharacterized protein LOC128779323 [Desmodus rotundus]